MIKIIIHCIYLFIFTRHNLYTHTHLAAAGNSESAFKKAYLELCTSSSSLPPPLILETKGVNAFAFSGCLVMLWLPFIVCDITGIVSVWIHT